MARFFVFSPKKTSIFAGPRLAARNSVVWVFQRKNLPYELSKVWAAGDVDKKMQLGGMSRWKLGKTWKN